MRYIYRHLLTKTTRLLVYIFIYLFVSASIAAIFGVFYMRAAQTDRYYEALKISLKLFYGLETETNGVIPNLMIAENVIRDIFFVSWIGSLLAKLLIPVNPLYFSKFCTYDSANRITFRYWIMVPSGRFLYDLEIHVYVKDETAQTGRNHLETHWKWDSKEQYLSRARGVRYIVITDENSNHSSEKEEIGQVLELCNLLKEGKEITVMIRGANEDGKIFYKTEKYSLGNMAVGYQFLSVMRNEFESQLSECFQENELKRFPFVQFQHFNKAYKENQNFESIFQGSEKESYTPECLSAEKRRSYMRFQNKLFSFLLNMEEGCMKRCSEKMKSLMGFTAKSKKTGRSS